LPRGEAARQQPILLRARAISGQPDLEAVAEGDVEFRRGGLVIRADRLTYDSPRDLASARGNVRIQREGAVYWGPLIELEVERFQGFFLEPRFEFPLFGSGGRADRIDFLDSARSVASNASYTSCPRDGPQEPAWLLQTRSVRLDLDRNEGIAEGAVLRFLGLPILALPVLSFPLGDGRKSGWLPPSINIDNRSGIELAVPYYWNIAPNRDATLVPRVFTRRGLAVDAEFRYLEPGDQGVVGLNWLPDDRVARASREAARWQHDGSLRSGLRYSADVVRVSDDDWWKDFPDANRSFTPRLLPLRLALEQPFRLGGATTGADVVAYTRLVGWQVLQGTDSPIASPYERSPQLGMRLSSDWAGWQFGLETEYNRFTLPDGEAARAGRVGGQRGHLLGSVSRPFREPSGWLIPKLTLNAARYATDDAGVGDVRRASRTIPTFSVDTGFELERRTRLFGRELQQTLEPRLLYVNTPYRAQSQLPNYDSAAKDFNVISLFSENTFSGIDRVADAHQITAGFTSRLLDADSGNEALRFGVVQRYLLRTQRVAARSDGSLDGPPLTQRFSDVLLAASTALVPSWAFDTAVQYSPEISRSVRSIVSARYSPGPFRTVGATYRLARGFSEQVEVGWQWPIGQRSGMAAIAVAQAQDAGRGAVAGAQGPCNGAWYTVGRFNYSLTDARVTDSVLGLEYDAGCWIGRVVAERLSTGRSEATTRLLLQLELVGLSRLGSNPLKVLKDNIPGYRLLREDRGSSVGSGGVGGEWQPAP
ncbi:MAG: LPS-assembly protein LptD, partial [Chitinophagaceae bacterium]|nr:LPS-assembly protein LptD [Rubrivivax sp.]